MFFMWNKRAVKKPDEQARVLTRDQIAYQLADANINLKQVKQYVKTYKYLYQATKRYLRDVKRQLEEVYSENDFAQQKAGEQQRHLSTSPVGPVYKYASGETTTRVLKRNPPQHLEKIGQLHFASVQQIKQRSISEDQFNVVQNLNIKLKDEIVRLRQAKQQAEDKIGQLEGRICNQNDALLKTENMRLEQQISDQNAEIATHKRQLRHQLNSIYQLQQRIRYLEEDKSKLLFEKEQEIICQQNICKDIERYLVESQQNFAALQEEAELRLYNTQCVSAELKCKLIESEAAAGQLANEYAHLQEQNNRLEQQVTQLCTERQQRNSAHFSRRTKSAQAFLTQDAMFSRFTPLQTKEVPIMLQRIDLQKVKLAGKQASTEELQNLSYQCPFASVECLLRLDEIWSEEIRRRLEQQWGASADLLLFVLAGGKASFESDAQEPANY